MSTSDKNMPRYPIYILSKGRWESRLTMKALDRMGVPYRVTVEPQEYDKYAAVLPEDKLLVLPFSNHGKGSGPARNWCWEHSITEGHKRHWLLDDNIREFWRYNHNNRIRVDTGAIFRASEDFVDRYDNIALAGMQYKFFVIDDIKYPPIVWNTRMMSCILIENSTPHRWRGKFNEDVDLSLRVLKDGYATVLFYAFLCGKMRTGTVKGGNTEELYGDGTFEKSKMLVNLHPDVVRLVRRYGRWHHHVDISQFRDNDPKLKKDIVIPEETNEYGMVLVEDFGLPTQYRVDKPVPRKNFEKMEV